MLAKVLIGAGVALVAAGLIMQYAPWLVSWFGRLPGDIDITRGNSRVYVPLTSMIIVSIVLTLIVNFLFRR